MTYPGLTRRQLLRLLAKGVRLPKWLKHKEFPYKPRCNTGQGRENS